MPLVFLPDAHTFFLWGEPPAPGAPHALATRGQPAHAELVVPEGRQRVAGFELPLLATLAELAVIPTAHIESLSGSVAAWALASKLGIELVSRERVVPTITRRGGRVEARWGAALSAGEDAARVAALARSMPPAAHAVPLEGAALDVWAPDALLRAYLDALVDALVRGPDEPRSSTKTTSPRRKAGGARPPPDSAELPWERRWRSALEGPHSSFEARGFGERSLTEELERWSQAALGARDRLRACFRLELPAADREPFVLRFLLQSPDDPSLIATASEVWQASGRSLARLGLAFRDPEESLLEALGRAARLFPPIERALASPKPEALQLDAEGAWAFLGPGAAALADAGFGGHHPHRAHAKWTTPLASADARQATDRAYRIGQTRVVQVHKLVCAGTVEDKVDELLERKRKLAGQVIGSGEKWITEMPDSELRELFALSASAVVASDESVDDVSAPRPAPKKKKRASARGAGGQT